MALHHDEGNRGLPVPGYIGFYATGDKSYEFYKNPMEFSKKYIQQYNSSVFQCRILNKATIFITSNEGVRELLEDKNCCLDMGYKDFGYMHSIYGDLLLFSNKETTVSRLRYVIRNLFCSTESVTKIIEKTNEICDYRLPDFLQQKPIIIYDHFKKLATEICLSVFLGLDFVTCDKEATNIVDLTVTHWHGLISFPIFFKFGFYTSRYALALEAQDRLLQIIKQRLSHDTTGCLLDNIKNAGFENIDELSRHMLLFVSALVPKALSSILTSCCLELGKAENIARLKRAHSDEIFVDKIVLEISRLWPPFLGGRRLAKKTTILQGFRIPKDYSVCYLTRNANLDPEIFKNPEEFLPERWEESNAPNSTFVYTFGFGRRNCIGDECIKQIIRVIMQRVLGTYDWCLDESQDLTYKWLPVSRPKNNVQVKFTSRTETAK